MLSITFGKIPFYFSVVLISLALNLFASSGSSVRANSSNSTVEADSLLLDYFEKKCSAIEIKPNAFPDLYLSRSDLNSCDIAAMFNPEKFNFKYHLLKLANQEAIQLIPEYDLSRSIVSNHFGIPKDNQLSDLDKAIKGDIVSYNILAETKEFLPGIGGVGLDKESIKLLSTKFDPIVTELMFLNNEDLYNTTTKEKIYKYSDHLLNKANFIERPALIDSVWRISQMVYWLYGDKDLSTYSSIALKTPHDLRLRLLALQALSGALDPLFDKSLRIIEYNKREYSGHFSTGSEENFYLTTNKTFDELLIKTVFSLKEALSGGLGESSPVFAIENLQMLKSAQPDLFSQYKKIGHQEVYNFALDFDLGKYKLWRQGLIDGKPAVNKNKKFKTLLVLDLRYALAEEFFPEEVARAEKIIKKNPEIAKEIYAIPNDILLISYLLNLSTYNPEKKNVARAIKIFKNISSNENICENLNKTICDKNIRSITHALENHGFDIKSRNSLFGNLSAAFAKMQDELKNEGRQELYSCKFSRWKKKLLKFSFEAGAFDPNVLRWCSSQDFIGLDLGKNRKLNIQEIVSRSGAFPPSPGIDYLNNQNLWNVSQLGLILDHFSKSTQLKEVTRFPDMGVGLYAKSLPVFQLALNNKNTELFLFNNYDGNYWETTKPYGSIADLFLSKGKYELAYFAQEKRAELAKENLDPLGRVIFPITLSRLKFLGKKANIPDKFLSLKMNELRSDFDFQDLFDKNGKLIVPDEMLSFLKSKEDQNLLTAQLKVSMNYLKGYDKVSSEKIALEDLPALYNLTDQEIKTFCDNDTNLKFIVSVSQSINRFMTEEMFKFFGDEVFMYELYRFLSVCMINRDEVLDYSSLILEYILPNLENGTDLFNPNFFPVIQLVANYSNKSESLVGTYFSLVYAKHHFSDLAKGFVNGNSSALRENQNKIESLLAEIMSTLKSADKTQISEIALSRIFYQTQKLIAAFHTPILSYKTLERIANDGLFFMPEGNGKSNRNQLPKLIKSHKKVDQKVAAASDPRSIILAKSEYSNNEIEVFSNILAISENLEFSINKVNETGLGFNVQANMIASEENLYVQTLSQKFGFSWEVFKIDEEELINLKKRFSKGVIDEEMFNQACKLFKPLRQYFTNFFEPADIENLIYLTPSVNLMPIPPNVIVGSYCGDLNSSVILTGDVAASLELAEKMGDFSIPKKFVGVGNPMKESDTKIAINLGKGSIFRGDGETTNNVLSTLSPLPDAVNEIIEIAELFQEKKLFINEKGSISEALSVAEDFSKNDDGAIVTLATHAFAVNYAGDINLPSMLTIENDNLDIITANKVTSFELENSIALLSACDTAAGYTDRTDLFLTGFVEAFANAGSKFITASLWPIKSSLAKDTSIKFLDALKNEGLASSIRKLQSVSFEKDSAPLIYIYP